LGITEKNLDAKAEMSGTKHDTIV